MALQAHTRSVQQRRSARAFSSSVRAPRMACRVAAPERVCSSARACRLDCSSVSSKYVNCNTWRPVLKFLSLLAYECRPLRLRTMFLRPRPRCAAPASTPRTRELACCKSTRLAQIPHNVGLSLLGERPAHLGRLASLSPCLARVQRLVHTHGRYNTGAALRSLFMCIRYAPPPLKVE